MAQNFFPQRPSITPTIYAYRLIGVDTHKGYLKVGYTDRTAKERIEEQLHTSKVQYEIVLVESAMSNDGSCFTDKDVHRLLERKGCKRLNPLDKTDEWFRCSVADVMAAILSLRTGVANEENRTQNFTMRPEQFRAVEQTKTYFEQALKEEPNRIPKFLWNAKMRFGKTFASYQLAKKMGLSRILILTFKPAVESAWREDLVSHIDFEGWQYISNKDARNNNLNIDQEFHRADKSKPIVVFGSFQDLLGTNESGGIKTKNEFIHATNWDLVIFDEYHFGAWKERAKELFEKEDEESAVDLMKRVLVSLPLFAVALFIIFALPFQAIWSYFAWMNQTLAAITLWCITLYLAKHDKPVMIGLLPALFMTYTCSSYIFVSPMMAGMENRVLAYTLGGILTVAICVAILFQSRRSGE